MPESNPNLVPAIACKAVETTVAVALNRPILNQISLTIHPGEFVALLGLNGAGKSTLLRAIVGLTPVKQGEIAINGNLLTSRSLTQVRRDIGMLFQGGGLIPQLPAIENVLCGRLGRLSPWKTLAGFSQSDRRRALDLLAQLGLREQAYQQTRCLSGGQQQRVAIARALIQSPKILLVDEPTTGLDVLAARQVMDILADLHQQQITVVAVLHDLELAATYAQRAIVLNQGRVAHDGSCQNLAAQFA